MYMYVYASIWMYTGVLVSILLYKSERTLFCSVPLLHSWRGMIGTWKLACGGHDSGLWQEEGNTNEIANRGWPYGGSLGNCPRQFPSHILGKLPLVPAGLPRLRKPPVLHQLLGHDLASGLQEGWEMNNKKQIARTICPCMPLLMVCSLLCSLGKLCCCVDCNFTINYPNLCIYMQIHAKYWL